MSWHRTMADLFLSAWDTMQHIPVWHRRGWSVCLRPSQHGYRRLIKTCMGVSAAQWLVCLCASVSTWLPQAHQDLHGSLGSPVAGLSVCVCLSMAATGSSRPAWESRQPSGWSVCVRLSRHGCHRIIKTCMGVSAAQWLVCLCTSVSTWLPQAHQDLHGSLGSPVAGLSVCVCLNMAATGSSRPAWESRQPSGWSVCVCLSQHGCHRLIKTCVGVSVPQWWLHAS